MLYVFEGPRNSGKTYLSNLMSDHFGMPRYQFSFADYFSILDIKSQNSKEAHAFSLGKELMIMQIARDLHNTENERSTSFIHDRGILTVLAWGILEGRITESEMEEQIKMIKEKNLMKQVTVIFINGDNPDKDERNKDQWDRIDGDKREFESYEKVIRMLIKYGIGVIHEFKNEFNEDSKSKMIELFRTIIKRK